MKTFNQEPNFSIVMQGGCNAECDFCFNKQQGEKVQCSKIDYIINLWETLRFLPSQFYQISITGNEPMLSPLLEDIMDMCAKLKNRYTNILITTNGTNLISKYKTVINGVHHINLSRHHYDYEENKKIFKGSWNVTDNDMETIIDLYSSHGIDVSLNCVINDNTTEDFINKYIEYAKSIGAFSVRFRKENGTLDMTPVEKTFADKYKILWHGECPACRTDLRVIKGLKTYWKSSVLEPSDTIKDNVFELVYATDGKVYLDWSQKKPYDVISSLSNMFDNIKHEVHRMEEMTKHKRTYVSSSSCGGGSCGRSSRC